MNAILPPLAPWCAPGPHPLATGRKQALAACAALLFAVQACGGGGGGASGAAPPAAGSVPSAQAPAPAPTPNPPSAPTPAPAPAAVGVRTVASGLSSPWGLAFLPDGRMLVTEKGGTLKLLAADGTLQGAVGGVPAVDSSGQGGLLDVVPDPAFTSNSRIYFSFSERDAANASLNGTAVARAELNTATRTLANTTVIYRQQPKVAGTSNHYGSRLVFDRDGHLFVTLGDRQINSQRGFAQDLARGNGKVARITVAGAPAPGNPAWSAAGAQPAFWSYGHRNPQGAALHPDTGELWTSEHGPQGGDEVNRTLPGRNYGWPLVSRGQEYGTTMQVGLPSQAGVEEAAWVWERIDGSPYSGSGAKSSPAPAGMAFYTGSAVPQWRGNLFVASLAGTALWRLTLGAGGTTVTAQERLLANLNERMRDVDQGPDGALYILTDSGKVLRYGP